MAVSYHFRFNCRFPIHLTIRHAIKKVYPNGNSQSFQINDGCELASGLKEYQWPFFIMEL